MSYLRITSRCNQACPHCCYSCRPGTGVDMQWGTFVQAVEFAYAWGYQTLALGGGEPLLHPRWEEMLDYLLNVQRIFADGVEKHAFNKITIVTNGLETEAAGHLADRMQSDHRIDAYLSVDKYHQPVDKDLQHRYWSLGQTRNTTRVQAAARVGAALDHDEVLTHSGRVCMGGGAHEIDPDGSIWVCVHRDCPCIGHVGNIEGQLAFSKYIDEHYEARTHTWNKHRWCAHQIPTDVWIGALRAAGLTSSQVGETACCIS